MAKILFDIKYKSQIESGEYKVETRDGLPARIICWDCKSTKYPILALYTFCNEERIASYDVNGYYYVNSNDERDLFIITPEPQLAESEDERIRKALINVVINDKDAGHTEFYNNQGITCDDALAYLEKQKEQKPKEPGYKHEDYFCEKCQANAFNEGRESALKEQKPAEWSEEDEINRQIAIGKFEGTEVALEWDIEQRVIEWLKSLRPRPHWKPSEEQMEALSDAYVEASTFKKGDILESLYNDLKKL